MGMRSIETGSIGTDNNRLKALQSKAIQLIGAGILASAITACDTTEEPVDDRNTPTETRRLAISTGPIEEQRAEAVRFINENLRITEVERYMTDWDRETRPHVSPDGRVAAGGPTSATVLIADDIYSSYTGEVDIPDLYPLNAVFQFDGEHDYYFGFANLIVIHEGEQVQLFPPDALPGGIRTPHALERFPVASNFAFTQSESDILYTFDLRDVPARLADPDNIDTELNATNYGEHGPMDLAFTFELGSRDFIMARGFGDLPKIFTPQYDEDMNVIGLIDVSSEVDPTKLFEIREALEFTLSGDWRSIPGTNRVVRMTNAGIENVVFQISFEDVVPDPEPDTDVSDAGMDVPDTPDVIDEEVMDDPDTEVDPDVEIDASDVSDADDTTDTMDASDTADANDTTPDAPQDVVDEETDGDVAQDPDTAPDTENDPDSDDSGDAEQDPDTDTTDSSDYIDATDTQNDPEVSEDPVTEVDTSQEVGAEDTNNEQDTSVDTGNGTEPGCNCSSARSNTNNAVWLALGTLFAGLRRRRS